MNDKDFAVSVNKFFYYAMNYPCVEITYPTLFKGEVKEYLPSFFDAFPKNEIEHLWSKFQYMYTLYGSRGAMMSFYGELDGTHRYQLLSWINQNYTLGDSFGISLPVDECA